MKMTMLNYSKLILRKVSFDKRLFWKEYKKMCKSLTMEELMDLRNWVNLQLQSQESLVTT